MTINDFCQQRDKLLNSFVLLIDRFNRNARVFIAANYCPRY